MTPSDLLPFLLAWATWLIGDGRAHVFVALMAIFLAAFVATAVRRPGPATEAAPLFMPPRRPPAPDEPGWRKEAELAAMLLEAGRAIEALHAYRQLIALNPADPDALYNLGHAYFRLRLYAQARTCWRGVRRLEPRAVDARTNLRLVARLLRAEA